MRTIPRLHRIDASIQLPGSREETIRALLSAAVTPGEVRLRNAADVDESRLVLDTIRTLGWEVEGTFANELRIGDRVSIYANEVEIDPGSSELTIRWLLPFLSFTPGRTMLRTSKEIDVRELVDSLRSVDAEIEYPYLEGKTPVGIRGKLIRGGGEFSSSDDALRRSMLVMARTFPDGLRIDGEWVVKEGPVELIDVPPEGVLVSAWRELTDRLGGRITINGDLHDAGAPFDRIEPRDEDEREVVRVIGSLAAGEVTVENESRLARAFPRFWRVLDEVVASSQRAAEG